MSDAEDAERDAWVKWRQRTDADVDPDLDRDFTTPDLTIESSPVSPYRETLRLLEGMIALLDRIIDERGVS